MKRLRPAAGRRLLALTAAAASSNADGALGGRESDGDLPALGRAAADALAWAEEVALPAVEHTLWQADGPRGGLPRRGADGGDRP